jgi:uncharacterized protein (TIGR03118 family)
MLLLPFSAAAEDQPANSYATRVLVVNRPAYAAPDTQIVDPLLVNPWGSAIRTAGLGGHFWLANAGSNTVTEYIGDVHDQQGQFVPLYQDALRVVAVDGPPIGQVFSASASDFPVTGSLCSDDALQTCDASQGAKHLGIFTGPARFIVATEDGKIAAWTEGRLGGQFGRMRKFETVVDNSGSGALYRGLAVTDFPSDNWLCAANFSQGRIDCYDKNWQPIGPVHDGPDLIQPFATPASIPSGGRKTYVPFNIQYLGGHFYVAYAELIKPSDPDFDTADPIAERACPGCGFVAIFNRHGRHLHTFASHGQLNAPWGLAIAPHGFGKFSNALLVGNFGDGTLVGFDLRTRKALGYLRDGRGRKIVIDGLWAIFFGNGASLGRAEYLYWTAGFNAETDGGFGSVHYVGRSGPHGIDDELD